MLRRVLDRPECLPTIRTDPKAPETIGPDTAAALVPGLALGARATTKTIENGPASAGAPSRDATHLCRSPDVRGNKKEVESAEVGVTGAGVM